MINAGVAGVWRVRRRRIVAGLAALPVAALVASAAPVPTKAFLVGSSGQTTTTSYANVALEQLRDRRPGRPRPPVPPPAYPGRPGNPRPPRQPRPPRLHQNTGVARFVVGDDGLMLAGKARQSEAKQNVG